MPRKKDFTTVFDYYRTLFHEYIHSTGHQDRLNRLSGAFSKKSSEYAKEELVAEFGAVFLSAHAGIMWRTNENHAEYLKNWLNALKHLKKDNKLLMRASSQAQKATDFILNLDKNGEPSFYKELLSKTKTSAKSKIGYALVDNINGSIIASKKTLSELKKYYNSTESNDLFSGLSPIVHEIIKKKNKNTLGKKVVVDWVKESTGLNAPLKSFKDIKEAKKYYLDWASKNLIGKKVYHKELEKWVKFNFTGVKHSITSFLDKDRISLITQAEKMLENSKFIEFQEDYRKRRNIKGAYKMESTAFLNGKNVAVILTLREGNNGIIYYDHKIEEKYFEDFIDRLEKENSDKPSTPTRTKKSCVADQPKRVSSHKDTTNKPKTKGLSAVETVLYVDNEVKGVKIAPKVNNEAVENPKRVKTLKGLRSMNVEIEKAPLFNIQGVTGQFLQAVERKPKESVVAVLSTPQGTGKTTTVYKWMNDIAPMYSTLFLSLEEHPDSNLATDKRDKYLSPQAQANINTAGSIPNKEILLSWIEAHEVIVIDSWQKLETVGKINFDKDLRKAFDGKLFIIIFQQTTDGKAKGGSDKVFDGDIIIYGEKGDSFNENYLYFDKNRYTTVSLDEIRYNIANHEVYNPKEPEEIETKEVVLEV